MIQIISITTIFLSIHVFMMEALVELRCEETRKFPDIVAPQLCKSCGSGCAVLESHHWTTLNGDTLHFEQVDKEPTMEEKKMISTQCHTSAHEFDKWYICKVHSDGYFKVHPKEKEGGVSTHSKPVLGTQLTHSSMTAGGVGQSSITGGSPSGASHHSHLSGGSLSSFRSGKQGTVNSAQSTFNNFNFNFMDDADDDYYFDDDYDDADFYYADGLFGGDSYFDNQYDEQYQDLQDMVYLQGYMAGYKAAKKQNTHDTASTMLRRKYRN